MMGIVDVLVVCTEVYVALLALEYVYITKASVKNAFLIKNYHFIGIYGVHSIKDV